MLESTRAAVVLGADAGLSLNRRLAVTGSARLNMPFGTNRVIFRAGAGLRWIF